MKARFDTPFESWGETKEKRAIDDRHAGTQAYIDYMRPRCVKPSGDKHGLPSYILEPEQTIVAVAWE